MSVEMIPGAILQGAIMSALRMKNKSAKAISEEHGMEYRNFRNAMFGMSMADSAKQLREQIIDIAGREMVEHLYTTRMLEEADKLRSMLETEGKPRKRAS